MMLPRRRSSVPDRLSLCALAFALCAGLPWGMVTARGGEPEPAAFGALTLEPVKGVVLPAPRRAPAGVSAADRRENTLRFESYREFLKAYGVLRETTGAASPVGAAARVGGVPLAASDSAAALPDASPVTTPAAEKDPLAEEILTATAYTRLASEAPTAALSGPDLPAASPAHREETPPLGRRVYGPQETFGGDIGGNIGGDGSNPFQISGVSGSGSRESGRGSFRAGPTGSLTEEPGAEGSLGHVNGGVGGNMGRGARPGTTGSGSLTLAGGSVSAAGLLPAATTTPVTGTTAPQPAAAAPTTPYLAIAEDNGIVNTTQGGTLNTLATIKSGDAITGIAFSGGSLYAADNTAGTISKISSTGAVSSFATLGSSTFPTGIAFDKSGNLYVALANNTISKINSSGGISSFATLASNATPGGLAFDKSGNLYVANSGNQTISKINSSGTVSLFATVSGASNLQGLAFDASGNLYVSDGNTSVISKITSGGLVSTYVTVQGTYNPLGLAFDGSGDLFAACESNIEEITPGLVQSDYVNDENIPEFLAFVPEPATWLGGALLGGVALLAGCRRRLRRA